MMCSPESNFAERVRGYKGYDIPWNKDFDEAKKTMKNYVIQVDTPTLVLFDNYLKECDDKNISVILVYPPVYKEGQKFITNRDEIINYYKYYSKKNNILFLDFSNDPISYKKQYFYNSVHLNKKGSELFTNELINRIKSQIDIQQIPPPSGNK